MITKEELLVALEDSSRNLYKSNEVFGLALKGLESESTVKRLIQDRDNWKMMHENLVCEHRIAVGILNDTVGGLRRNRNFWKKKHDDLADELGVLKGEIEMGEEAHRAQNADIDKLITENKKLARREREFSIVLGEWAAVEVYLAKSPKLTIGDKFSVACLRLLQERDKLEADLRFLLGH